MAFLQITTDAVELPALEVAAALSGIVGDVVGDTAVPAPSLTRSCCIQAETPIIPPSKASTTSSRFIL